jgi:proteasome lid subunit RPN8/RPN11
MKFLITSGVEQQLLAAAATAAPEECCGLLLGRPGVIETAVPARNVAYDRSRSFEIDPAVLLRTHREARGAGLKVVGHYHSHPNGVAEPSKRDAAQAVEDGQLWVIVAGGRLSGWRAGAATPDALHNRFHPVTLEPA